jgi:coproporphyrinogen III oxidase-like Fe-S oxidoreductase
VIGADPGFGVYIHWPFCAAKCPYCDFNSHVRHQKPDQARYAAAFAREIATIAARTPGRTVSSIFLGGGTPSLMEPATVGAILDAVGKHWSLDKNVEVTLEANPSSVEAERFRGYRAAGVNRVSLGVQVYEGRVAGRLVWPPRGTRGFGYDPMFQPDGEALTFGEMAPDDKHAMSHRARAFSGLRQRIGTADAP